MALVEWGDAAEPVLGAGALSLLLVADPDDEGGRTVTVTAAGTSWADRWDGLVAALAPWAVAREAAGHRDGHRSGRCGRAVR